MLNNNELYSDFKYMMQGLDYEEMYKDSYDIINISLPGNEMKISGYRVNAEGTPMSIAPMLEKINTSFTTQMPPETIAVMALGKPSPEFINILLDNAGLGAGVENIRPYIEACTGTISVSVAAPEQFTRLLHKEDWRFTVTAQYDREKAKEIMAMAGYLADMNIYLEY
ncbi:MAG: hypothetical protein K2M12_06330, partial [Muribaculaceae bacterium]|nr:hypothetical protein [Muribaculaceae bacterium]